MKIRSPKSRPQTPNHGLQDTGLTASIWPGNAFSRSATELMSLALGSAVLTPMTCQKNKSLFSQVKYVDTTNLVFQICSSPL